MFLPVVWFELRYQLRSAVFVIGAILFLLFSFGSVAIEGIEIGASGNVNFNSPVAICQTVAIMGIFMMFVVCAGVANVVLRDDETGFAPLVRATQVSKRSYLCGRFSGAILVGCLVLAMVPIGIFLGSLMPWVDSQKIGPFVLAHYLYAYALIGLPSLLVLGSILFATATLTRSMMWSYVALLALLVIYFVSRLLLREPTYDTIAVLTDPFGLSALFRATHYWTATERNTLMPPLDAITLAAHALWLGVGAAAFGAAYAAFSFGEAGSASRAKSTRDRDVPAPARVLSSLPAARASGPIPKLVALTRFDLRFVFRSPAFFVLLGLGGLNALGALASKSFAHGVDYYPVTRAMIDALNDSFWLFSFIIAVYYSGELVWRDHDRRVHEIVGATPAPDWTFVVPKVLAITLALFATFVFASAVAVIFQGFNAYTQFEPEHYLVWFILPMTVQAFQLAALAIFFQVLTPHKAIGWGCMLVFFMVKVSLAPAGFEHHLYDYAGGSPVPLSDMNGLGRFWIGGTWFELYWSAAAIILLMFAYGMWRRGADVRFRARAARLGRLAHGIPAAVVDGAALVLACSGAFIFYNTNILNHYQTAKDLDRDKAEFEKTLLGFETVPQPRITDVKLTVDMYPRDTRVLTHGDYVIENRTGAPLPGVHVRWDRRTQMTELEVEGAHLDKEFARFHYRIYAFDKALQPGERRTIHFVTLLEERGFPNEHPLTEVVANGTFVDNALIAPMIGMDRNDLLSGRAKRRRYELQDDLRMPKLEDQSARAVNYLRHDSDWVNADITLSTDADQTPVAPGYTVSDETRNGRRTVHTHTEAPILQYFSLQSARYAEAHDQWSGAGHQPVALTVYYHPQHQYNVARMLEAMKVSLDVYSEQFSSFQFRQMRVLEFPDYRDFAESFANTVPYSEALGFIEKFDPSQQAAGQKIDFDTYVIAHELAHQWWAHQIIGADMQGSTMLSESFAQYSALLVMEKMYGPAMIRKFLKYSLDTYLKRRGGEEVEELPLERVENQPYIHYDKGALVMYWLKESVGEDVVNRALRRLLAQYAFKPAPYPSSADFVRILREEAGPKYDSLISDLFERITVYDMRADAATARLLPDGRYEVQFTVEGHKLYADGAGKEQEDGLSESFEVGAFLAQPGTRGFSAASVLVVERQLLHSGKQELRLVTDKLPVWVGVDPYNKVIDRKPDDNLTEVRLSH